MHINIPSQISLDGFLKHVDHIGAAHGHMMFKAVFADIFHQLLQIVNFGHGDATIHAIRVVSNLALTEISLDAALGVIGGNAEESEVARGDFSLDCAKSIDFA